MHRWIMLAATAALALSACTADETGSEPSETAGPATGETVMAPAPPTDGASHAPAAQTTKAASAETAGKAEGDTCGADKVKGWMSAEPTPDIKAQIAKAAGDRPIRYYTDGDPITMDYSEARLNVVLGKDGRITEFRCG